MTLLLATCLATSCIARRGVAIASSPSRSMDTVALRSFLVVQRIATRQGFLPSPGNASGATAWPHCFVRGRFELCGFRRGGEVQMRMTEYQGVRFPAWAHSLRRELRDSLRTEINVDVRDCSWGIDRDGSQGCDPPRPRQLE